MFTKMFKFAILLLLMMPLIASSETLMHWQKKTISSSNTLNVGYGAYISQQDDHLIVSAGHSVNSSLVHSGYLLEQMSEHDKQATTMYIIHGDIVTSTDLVAELGNRAYAATAPFYGASIVIGGIAHQTSSSLVNLLYWQPSSQTFQSFYLPSLPNAASSPAAVILDNTLYVLTGSENKNQFYAMDLSTLIGADSSVKISKEQVALFNHQTRWQELPALPIASKKYPKQNGIKLAVQNDGSGKKIFAIGGYQSPLQQTKVQGDVQALSHYWSFDPSDVNSNQNWQTLGDISLAKRKLNQQINALSTFGQSHILAFTNQGDTLSYNAITNSWTQYLAGNHHSAKTIDSTPYISENISTFAEKIYSLNRSKEAKTALELWQVTPDQAEKSFGWVNMTVLVVYLICVVLVGLFFVFKNRNTDDYFRGGQSIPWWAAACSIYATMLSSLTYVALPAVVYQSNWLLLIGIWMIIAVAPVAIYVAMPFFRQIDATSAYEYLSKRFNMSVRLFASGLFTLFHIGRMGIVMALTALALSAVTPLSASDSVLIMGVLCLIYCTMGGIEAVIWTDTLQTIVLIIGAITCFVTIIMGLDGGLTDFISIGLMDDKFTMVNADFSLDSITTLSIWVIVIGGIGQNISSYTADQAVVQRYMVTKDPAEASKSIWANAIIAAPGALLFFCIGTGLYAFYQLHPEKLDPSIQIDQIFPTFIATELPIGIAGLIVAGIFAAAQSTVSTSMNSIATTLVTDFIRPFNLVKTEKGYMSAARWLTFIMGALGTLAGLVFINPEIRSLMEAYFKVIGMFMGALGGLFVLGALTKKANSFGAIVGILAGVATMISAWQMGWANGYLYATIGIVSCLVIGYLASLLTQTSKTAKKDLTGLTLYTMQPMVTKSS